MHNKISRVLKKNTLLVSMLFNLLLFAIIYSIYTPHFMTNDDVKMMLRVAGMNRVLEPSAYIHSNIILGNFLTWLYALDKSIPWYAIYTILSLFIAHVAFLYRILRNSPLIRSMFMYLVYFIIVGVQILLNLQFTITAGILSFAGVVLLFFEPKKMRRYYTLQGFFERVFTIRNFIGVLLIFFGSLVRWYSTLLVFGLFLPVVFIQYVFRPFYNARVKVALFVLTFFLCYSGVKYEKYKYRQDIGWKKHLENIPSLVSFIDYQVLENVPIQKKVEILATADWSLNDYYMLMHWFSMNEDLYNKVNFEKILSQVPKVKTNLPFKRVYEITMSILTNQYSISCIFLWFFVSLMINLRLSKILQLFVSLILPIIAILYLIFFRKPPPPRVWYIIMIFITWIPLLLLSKKNNFRSFLKVKLYKKIILCLFAFLLLYNCFLSIQINSNNSKINYESNIWFHNLMDVFNPNPNNLYIVWGEGFPYPLISPFDNLEYLENLNTIGVGVPPTPTTKEVLAKYNIKDVYMAMLEKNNVFLCLHPAHKYKQEMLEKYMLEHYNLSINYNPIFRSGAFNVYKITEMK